MLGLRNIRDWARRRAMGAASHAGRGSCVTTPAGQIAIPGEDVSTFRERMFSYWASLGHPPATCEMFLADAINTEGYADVASRASRVMGSLSGKSVLDVGCGWGGLSRVLSACGARVTMLDPHPPHVDVARARVPSATGFAGSGTDLLDLGLQDGSFDHVFVYSVIEHVGLPVDHRGNAEPVLEIQRRVIAEAARVLKPGGSLLITTGNYNFPLDQEVQIWFFHSAACYACWRPRKHVVTHCLYENCFLVLHIPRICCIDAISASIPPHHQEKLFVVVKHTVSHFSQNPEIFSLAYVAQYAHNPLQEKQTRIL